MKTHKPKRIIDYLREKHPDLEWSYDINELYRWRGKKDGIIALEVGSFSALAPRYDGDDDGFVTKYHYKSGEPFHPELQQQPAKH